MFADELIKILKDLPKDAIVCVYTENGNQTEAADAVYVSDNKLVVEIVAGE